MQQKPARRRHFRRVGAGVVGRLCAAAVLACTAKEPLDTMPTWPCTVEPLALADTLYPEAGYEHRARLSAFDPTGRFVAGYYAKESSHGREPTSYVAVVWDNGVPLRLDAPGPGTGPTDVNEHGWVVGSSTEVRHV